MKLPVNTFEEMANETAIVNVGGNGVAWLFGWRDTGYEKPGGSLKLGSVSMRNRLLAYRHVYLIMKMWRHLANL